MFEQKKGPQNCVQAKVVDAIDNAEHWGNNVKLYKHHPVVIIIANCLHQ